MAAHQAITWNNSSHLPSRAFMCGHCGERMATQTGYFGALTQAPNMQCFIYVCHFCTKPTYFDNAGAQVPGPAFGDAVKSISDPTVEALYNEARMAYSVGSYTASVLCCRKLLMHIAVDKGAGTNLPFTSYVKYLADNHIIPIGSAGWVDHIRTVGNDANHEIVIMSVDEATRLISFSAMLLKVVYEFPASVESPSTTPRR